MDFVPAKAHVVLDYFRAHGRAPNLKCPQTFNEKVVWRKLYDRDDRLPDLVDKIKSKEIIAERYGRELIIPTLAVFDTADQIDFARLTPPYVIKANHGSAMNLFVIDDSFDRKETRRRAAKFLRTDFAALNEEWAYSQVERKLFVEPFIVTPEGYLIDYKFHVFSGKVFAVEVVVDRFGNYGAYFCDRDYNPLDVHLEGYAPYKGQPVAPSKLTEMLGLAEAIGAEFSYVRVDLYESYQQAKFGELTFYPGGGYDGFEPREWDLRFGQQWTWKNST